MSTTTPIKFKKVSANWETIKGSYHEAPTSFDFSKGATSEQRTKKDMTNITSILTKAEIHALLWKGKKMMGQNIFHFL